MFKYIVSKAVELVVGTKPPLNLVLCGRRQTEKTSAAESILGRAGLPAESSPGQCVQHQGEVCGRWVSVVELPVLSGKPLEAVMQQSLSCLSLCGPEGVHAFFLVLPLGPLTDKDKAEIKTIQDTFSSAVNPFTMILFTVDSDPTAPALVDFVKANRDLQKLCQSCGGGYLIFNTRGQQQVPELLESVETLKATNKPHSYTTERLVQAQAKKITALQKENVHLKNQSAKTRDHNQSSDCLRIALIGKTGCGKSTSGNTILGNKKFKAKLSQTSVTRVCLKAQSTVDGRHVAVVDTPGLFNCTLSHNEVNDEMIKCISLLAPGPHVFLLVLSIGRFTQEEKETLEFIKRAFGESAVKFTMILFTHGDYLVDDDLSIQNFIEMCDVPFRKLISDCGNRYHVFNNRDKENQTQVKELLEKIDAMVKENGGEYYTNDMLQEAEAAIQKEMKRLLQEKEEEMRRQREEMETKHQQEMEEIQQKMDKQKEEFEKEREQRKKELKAKEDYIKEEKEKRRREQKRREEEDMKRQNQEEIKRLEWEQKTRALEEKIKSEIKSRETFEMKLQESRRQMEEERGRWEEERKEWWEKRKQEDQQRRQVEKKIQEEMSRIEREKQLKEKELIEKEKKIKEEQEQRKREQEKREEEDRRRRKQEEMQQHHEWERKKKALEEKIKSEERRQLETQMQAEKTQIKKKKNEEMERELKDKEEKITALQRENIILKNPSVTRRDDLSSGCLRIVLIGRTGCGRSSSGNTILGREEFKVRASVTSVTRVCQKAQSTVDGRHVAVVDTPGLFNTSLSHDEFMKEMLKCFLSLLAPGPHVFLLVLSIGRFTQEEKETVELINREFGKGVAKFTIILFTGGDQLARNNESIQDYIETCDMPFMSLISYCGNRYHMFNNRYTVRTQVKELLEKIDAMVKENGGEYYTIHEAMRSQYEYPRAHQTKTCYQQ